MHRRGPTAEDRKQIHSASSRTSLSIAKWSSVDARSCPVIFPSISWAPRRPSSPPARLLRDERFHHRQSTVVGQRARASRIGLEEVIL